MIGSRIAVVAAAAAGGGGAEDGGAAVDAAAALAPWATAVVAENAAPSCAYASGLMACMQYTWHPNW